MRVSVYLPLILSLFVTPATRLAVRRVAPDVAARTIVASSAVATVGAVWGLALLAASWLGRESDIADGRWSVAKLAATSPVPTWIGTAAAVVLLAGAARCVHFAVSDARCRRALNRRYRSLRVGATLAVVEDPRPDAFALPGASGRIIATTGLLRALDPSERRVVLAHERAHVEHRHDRFVTAIEVAAALNPSVIPVRRDLRYALERWADEDAATAVGDRAHIARSLAHVAFLRSCHDGTALNDGREFGLARLGVADRCAALQAEVPPRRLVVAVAAFSVFATLTTWAACDATIALIRMVLWTAGFTHSPA